jgi:hypothetical protein
MSVGRRADKECACCRHAHEAACWKQGLSCLPVSHAPGTDSLCAVIHQVALPPRQARGMQQRHAVADRSHLHVPLTAWTGVWQCGTPHLRRRLACGAAQNSYAEPESTQMPRQRLQQLFSSEVPALLLERSIGARSSTDAALWEAVPFAGQILPDLPVAGNWPGLLQAALQRCVHRPAAAVAPARRAYHAHEHSLDLLRRRSMTRMRCVSAA